MTQAPTQKCPNCKKEIQHLWKYDGKIIKCPHCKKYVRICSLTYYFPMAVQIDEESIKYYKSMNIIQEYNEL